MKLTVLIEREDESGVYVVTCPALQGFVSQGETEEEAIQNIKQAIQGWLAVRNDMASKEANRQAALLHHEPKELALSI